MAAHGLTIARQLLSARYADDTALIRGSEHSLNAPGFDLGASDPGDGYQHLYQGVQHRDAGRIRTGLRMIASHLFFLDGYPSLEDASAAYKAFVRVGTRNWMWRSHLWRMGAPKAHKRAVPGSAPAVL